MHPQYLTLPRDEVTLLACKAAKGSTQHVSLSYTQFNGLNELHRSLRGGVDILDSTLECSARNCREFGDAVLNTIDELYALHTYQADSYLHSNAAALFFVSPNLMGSCVTVLDKIIENDKNVRWVLVSVNRADGISKWLTDIAKFFKNSQGVFKV